MAASANPSGNNQESSSATQKVSSSSATATGTNGVVTNSVDNGCNTGAVTDNSQTISALRHNPGISTDWTPEEQSLLEDLLSKYASEPTIVRYAKIAMKMKDKTVRDVALRCRWMTKKENGKRRKEDHSSRKSKDKKAGAVSVSIGNDCSLRKSVFKKKMKLKVYADRRSQPSRAVIIFCKVNGIQFDVITTILAKRQHLTPEFKEINPMGKFPAIVDGRLRLFESHAIMIYLASAFPSVVDHWYPNDLSKRAKIHSVLDWHHTNLRPGAAGYVMNTVLAPFLGLRLNSTAAAEAEKLLTKSLSSLETVWLKGNAKFLAGSNQPSMLSSRCLQILELKKINRLLYTEEVETRHVLKAAIAAILKSISKIKEDSKAQKYCGCCISFGLQKKC